jgi:glycosyltransferase involved in cell wall biosynthesis
MAQKASVVIPVYNEAGILTENTLTLVSYLSAALTDYEIILVENGSLDETGSIAEQLSADNPNIKTIRLPEPCLGEALKTGVMSACYDKIIYYPIDLSVNLSFIPESTRLLDTHQIIIGSKKMQLAQDHRPLNRRLASAGYHRAVQMLFRTDLTDTTCVKAYQRQVALELMSGVPSGSSVFETEVLLEAQRMGLDLYQIPVEVNDPRMGRQPLRYKILFKFQDLMSLRLDIISMISGAAMFLTGLSVMGYLSFQKLLFNHEGFLNPYSFLISMLPILFGAQGFAYGLFARLFLQLRREVTLEHSRRNDAGNVFKEEGK